MNKILHIILTFLIGKKEIGKEKTGRIKKNDRIFFLDIRNLYTYNLGNYKILKRTILSANTLRIILVFPQSLRICGNYFRKKYNVPQIWFSAAETLPHSCNTNRLMLYIGFS